MSQMVAAMDQDLERVRIVSGASIYSFARSILLPHTTRASGALSPRWP